MCDMTGAEVTYTVKEMFQEVDKKLGVIIDQLTTKANKVDVTNLADRLEALEDDVHSFKRLLRVGGAVLTTLAGLVLAIANARGGP